MIKHSTTVKALTAIIMMASGTALAQEMNSAYFTEDYNYRHDLNPAFGNSQNYVAIPALGNVSVKMQGNFGLGDILFKNPNSGYYNYTFMHPDVSVSEALSGFNKGDNKISADLGITILSAGFSAFDGYNTVELRSRTNINMNLPYELFEFAKDIRNKNYEFSDIGMRAISFAELAFGHSHQITDQLRVGGKFKLLFGILRSDMKISGMTANVSGDQWLINSGNAEANVNMKGIEFHNTTTDYKHRSGSYEHVDLGETKVKSPGISGFGLGIDMGAEYEVMEGLKVSAAINDLGFINWSNNFLLKQKQGTFTFDGFHDLKINDNNGISIDDQMDDYKDQLSDFVSFENKGDKGSKSTMLAATVNLGAEYKLPMYEQLSFGLLGQHHFAGDYSWTEGRLSANWAPLSWLNGGINGGINNYCGSFGWIINIHPNAFNFFIGMDHIIGKQSKEFIPLNSNAHISFGMNIAFGGSKKQKAERQAPVEKPKKEAKAKKEEAKEEEAANQEEPAETKAKEPKAKKQKEPKEKKVKEKKQEEEQQTEKQEEKSGNAKLTPRKRFTW